MQTLTKKSHLLKYKQAKKSNKIGVKHSKTRLQYGSGGTDLNSSLLNYYYYSSHNSVLISSQLKGTCSICIIDDFIDTKASTIGGSIELDLQHVDMQKRTISVDHYCSNKGLDLETILKKIITRYKSFQGTKYPLIISIDANGLSIPANVENFGKLWCEIMGKCFDGDNINLRPDKEITGETNLVEIMGKILFRWDYFIPDNGKEKDLISDNNTNTQQARINIIKKKLSKTIF